MLPRAPLLVRDLEVMLAAACALERLALQPAYQAEVLAHTPSSARLGAVPTILMGYDFHLTAVGPKLIEVNTNAGGLFWDGRWLAQPALWSEPLPERLMQMLAEAFPQGPIAIVDAEIRKQPMFPEMQAYAALCERAGIGVVLCDLQDLRFSEVLRAGERTVRGIYNRHTDFYLQQMASFPILAALEAGIPVHPNPKAYALSADKRRMVEWGKPAFLRRFLSEEDAKTIRRVLVDTRPLASFDRDALWRERRCWVFKPAASHAGKGVVLGRRITRKRFAALDPDALAQRYVPPAKLVHEGVAWKTDVRIYTAFGRPLAVAARLWRGQTPSFREGGGFTPVEVFDRDRYPPSVQLAETPNADSPGQTAA
ncbi:MAG: hypothetical protein D6771_01905 [Zetaproteobacteria bacterium]|nr:MAG: hypothetical protein D6771_01905 [Zetaproteobacteria bacterium]